jgi:hypothetical protein
MGDGGEHSCGTFCCPHLCRDANRSLAPGSEGLAGVGCSLVVLWWSADDVLKDDTPPLLLVAAEAAG